MRKFLSILMLVCLLCGLALPAGAEGEPQLYVKVGDNYFDELTIPEGFSRTVAFYTKNGETDEYVPLSREAAPPFATISYITSRQRFSLFQR